MLRKVIPLIFLLGCDASDRQLAVVGEWLEIPHTLEFCSDNRVSEDRVIEQANWWHKNISPDYPFFDSDQIVHSDCDESLESGVIRVRRADFGTMVDLCASAWAKYQWTHETIEDPPGQFNSDSYLEACTVHVGKLNTKWVIRHEFGHCWGWDHTQNDDWKHLMSPKVGHDTEGLDEVPSEAWIDSET